MIYLAPFHRSEISDYYTDIDEDDYGNDLGSLFASTTNQCPITKFLSVISIKLTDTYGVETLNLVDYTYTELILDTNRIEIINEADLNNVALRIYTDIPIMDPLHELENHIIYILG